MGVYNKIKLWLGWGPEYKTKEVLVDFVVKFQDEVTSGERSPLPIPAVDLSSIKRWDVYHNRILALSGFISVISLLMILGKVSEFNLIDVLELSLVGFSMGALLMVLSSYREIRNLNREGKIVPLGMMKNPLLYVGKIFFFLYVFVWLILPWLESAYGLGAPSIFVASFILSMWFWVLSIILWEKKNKKILISKGWGNSLIFPIEERKNEDL